MPVHLRVRGGIVSLACVPVSAAEPGKLYQIVLKTGDAGPFVHARYGPTLQLGPMPQGLRLSAVAHLVEYPPPDHIWAPGETIETPTARQVIEFLDRHAEDDVFIEVSPVERMAQISVN